MSPFYLGPAGTESELPYPDGLSRTFVVQGNIMEVASAKLRLHYSGSRREWQLNWTNLTYAELATIQTEVERLTELIFVVGTWSYPVLVGLGSYRADLVPGSSPQLYNVSLALRQSG